MKIFKLFKRKKVVDNTNSIMSTPIRVRTVSTTDGFLYEVKPYKSPMG